DGDVVLLGDDAAEVGVGERPAAAEQADVEDGPGDLGPGEEAPPGDQDDEGDHGQDDVDRRPLVAAEDQVDRLGDPVGDGPAGREGVGEAVEEEQPGDQGPDQGGPRVPRLSVAGVVGGEAEVQEHAEQVVDGQAGLEGAIERRVHDGTRN